jgi:RNA polymerase sigma factor (sigma-70 family)
MSAPGFFSTHAIKFTPDTSIKLIMIKSPWKLKILDYLTVERKKMIAYVRRLIDDVAERDSEDIVQDVVLNIFDRADITMPIENAAAYVYQALRNKVVDYRRKRRDTVSLDEDWMDETENVLFQVLPALRTEAVDEISRMEMHEILFNALSVLNDEEREILIATELEGRTFQEIAEESGTPLGTLLARKSRSLKKIKESFSMNN